MGVPNRCNRPTHRRCFGEVFVGIRRINRCRFPGNRVMGEIAIIIIQAGELMYSQHDPISLG